MVTILHAPIAEGTAHWAIWIHTLAESPCHETPLKKKPREEMNLQWEVPLPYQPAAPKGLGIFRCRLPTQGFVHRLGREKRPTPDPCIPSLHSRSYVSELRLQIQEIIHPLIRESHGQGRSSGSRPCRLNSCGWVRGKGVKSRETISQTSLI